MHLFRRDDELRGYDLGCDWKWKDTSISDTRGGEAIET